MENVLCRSCNKMIPKYSIGGIYVRSDNSIKMCKVCVWKNNHKDQICYDTFSDYEIDCLLYYFLIENGIYLNDIAKRINRSIDDMILLYRNLHLANHKCMIKTTCDYCLSEFDCSMANYSSSKNHYCSFDCYAKDKTNRVGHGEDSEFYNRISVLCDNCGKEIKIIPSKKNQINAYGESHNFCSHKCYAEFRSKYYVGEKSVNYHREFTDIARQHMSEACSASMHLRTRLNTSIQEIVNHILDEQKIRYINEYDAKYYSIDSYLPEYNLGIEVMGDYWHCNPMYYNSNGRNINATQIKDIIRDKKKHTYIANHFNFQLLYLWESDIRNRLDVCVKLIQTYINNGSLDNYNSFNWSLDEENNLVLNSTIIYPYFELDKSYYKDIAA